MDLYKNCITAPNLIWVAVDGNDTRGLGTADAPYATIEKALAVATSTRKNILVLPGTYQLTAANDITLSGTSITGLGTVVLTGAVGADYCFKTVFGAVSGAECTFRNLTINHTDDATQVGIQINNTSATGAMTVNLTDLTLTGANGNSVDQDHAVATYAIVVNLSRCTTNGPCNLVCGNDADVFKFKYGNLKGGLVTDNGNKDSEIVIAYSEFLLNGITGGHANQRVQFIASYSSTYATPNVVLEAVAADVETQTPQVIAFDAP